MAAFSRPGGTGDQQAVAIFARWPYAAFLTMPSDPTVYDLVLLLSLESDEDARTKVLADVESAISAGGGSVVRNQAWGRRPTTYPIRHQGEADYHLLQFSGPASLLESLSHSLGIADEVLRFRIIKVLPGQPEVSETPPPVMAGSQAGTSEAAEPTA